MCILAYKNFYMKIHSINDGVVTTSYYDSSNISKSTYNSTSRTLTVYFSYGKAYDYYNIPKSKAESFELAESQGSHLNKFIKDNYEYSLSGEFDKSELILEVKQAKEEYAKSEHNNLFELINLSVEDYTANGMFRNSEILTNIINTINLIHDK